MVLSVALVLLIGLVARKAAGICLERLSTTVEGGRRRCPNQIAS